jgi:hypothetical protein
MIDGDLIRRVFHYGSYPLLYAASDRFPLVGHEVSAESAKEGWVQHAGTCGFPENKFRLCSTRPARNQE